VLAKIPKGHAEMVAAAIRTIFAQPDAAHVRSQLDVIAGMLGRQFPTVEAMLRDAADELTAFAAVPASHWKKIWSTNPVRHEALLVRGEVGVLPRWVVAAA
jgi:putative transposase